MAAILGNQALEYIEEVTEGTTPTDPAMGWVALLNPVGLKLPQKYTTANYLAGKIQAEGLFHAGQWETFQGKGYQY